MTFKYRHFLSNNGVILKVIAAGYNSRALNTVDNDLFIDCTQLYSAEQYYYDFDLKQFVLKPDKPSEYHVFDDELKTWIDPRTIEQLRDAKWQEIKQQRDALRFAPIEFEGHFYQADPTSATLIMGAALAGQPRVFTTADNLRVPLSAEQLMQLYIALQQQLDTAQNRGHAARDAIEAAVNIDQLNEVKL